ncbi:MAG: putative molybdenum carrier protein [Acidobacteriota bacterium]
MTFGGRVSAVGLRKIVAGGQTGVDRGALRAGLARGLEIGGWCPPGRASEDGAVPDAFPLRETPRDRSPRAPEIPRSLRTEWNVRDAGATLILAPAELAALDPGTRFTATAADRYRRPLRVVDPAAVGAPGRIVDWLRTLDLSTLNVAGPSESTLPGVEVQVFELLSRVFKE